MELLGEVCLEYRRACRSDRVWLVGGASVVILADGAFHSGDFDLLASNEAVFREILLKHGFQDEKGRDGRGLSCMSVGCTQIIPILAGSWSLARSSTDDPTNRGGLPSN